MTDDRAESALRDALAHHLDDADFAPLDPAVLRAAAEDAATREATPIGRRRPRFLLVAAAARVGIMVLPVGMLFLRTGSADVAATAPAGAGGVRQQESREEVSAAGAPATPATDTAAGGAGEYSGAACPTAGPPFGGIADFAAILVWEGRTYVAALEESAELGPVVGQVTCPIFEISEGGTRPVPPPWPDGSATFLPAGEAIHAVVGEDPRCTLGVTFEGRDVPLRAEETPGC